MSDNLTIAADAMQAEMRSLVEQIDHLTARRQRIERALAYLSFEQAADPLLGEIEEVITPRDAAKLAKAVVVDQPISHEECLAAPDGLSAWR